jgi:RNA polymerase sigma-70 factor (ECF subfamily)
MPYTHEPVLVSHATPHSWERSNERRQELLDLFLAERNYFLWIANSILSNHAEAEDVLHNSFCSAWQAIASFRGEASMKTWFSRIVSNHALIALRKLRRNKLFFIEDNPQYLYDFEQTFSSTVENPEQIAVRQEALQLVRRHLASLPKETRAVIVLYLGAGRSINEIAQLRGKTRLSVTAHLHRGKAILRKSVGRKPIRRPQHNAVN